MRINSGDNITINKLRIIDYVMLADRLAGWMMIEFGQFSLSLSLFGHCHSLTNDYIAVKKYFILSSVATVQTIVFLFIILLSRS